MGIQPIDIQTLYTQMDKVSKDVVHQQQGASLQNAMVQDSRMKKEIEHKNIVSQTEKDEKSGSVNADGKSGSNGENQNQKKKAKSEIESSEELCVIKDPNLGKNLDISG